MAEGGGRLKSEPCVREGTAALLYAGRRIPIPPNGLTIGRALESDVVLDGERASRLHAEVVASAHAVELRDLGSRNGTRLDGVPVRRAPLGTGAEIAVGPFRLIFDGSAFLARDDRGSLRLDAESVTVRARDKLI